MWLFLSARLRTWLLLAVAVPLTHGIVHRIAAAVQARRPDSRPARVLGRADSAVGSVADRAQRRRRHR